MLPRAPVPQRLCCGLAGCILAPACTRLQNSLTPAAQAAGCTQQLTGAVHGKDYNRRYRLCQVHLRSSEVDVQGAYPCLRAPRLQRPTCIRLLTFARYHAAPAGVPSRWCQTCSRFQPLSAFQGSKRTCSDQLSALRVRRRARAAERSAPSEAAGEQAAAAACEPPLLLGADSDLLDWLAVSREPSRSALPPTDVAGLFVDAMPLHAAPAGADVAAPSLALALALPRRDLSAGHDREPDEPPPDEPHARAVGRERQADA